MIELDHSEVSALLSDYYEGSLSQEKSAALNQHLSQCAECHAEYEAFKRTMGSLQKLPPISAPSDFVGKVQKKIHARSQGRFFERHFLLRIPYEWISFLLILLMLAIYLIRIQDQVQTVKNASDAEVLSPSPDASHEAAP